VLTRYISGHRALSPKVRNRWGFVALRGATALFDTGPGALAHMKDIAHLPVSHLGATPNGFVRFGITL